MMMSFKILIVLIYDKSNVFTLEFDGVQANIIKNVACLK